MYKRQELDWPQKWVEEGKTRGSEWVQPLHCDERVISHMSVIEPALISENIEEKQNE